MLAKCAKTGLVSALSTECNIIDNSAFSVVYVDGSENVICNFICSAIIFQLFKVIMLEKCVLTILELNWN